MPWRAATLVLGMVGMLGAAGVMLLRQPVSRGGSESARSATVELVAPGSAQRGFPLLLSIGVIDSATRMGFLTFLPFLLRMTGADLPMIGGALTLIFAGGAAGKLVCGWLGVVPAVFLTEGLTAAGFLALLPLPLLAGLAILPLIGLALNGTSSVLYGTVPELVSPERRQRAFSIFYTGAIGAGAVSPALYGLASDAVGVPTMMSLIAGVVLLALPLAWALRPSLRQV